MLYSGGQPGFAAGHLTSAGLVDVYEVDGAITVTGGVDGETGEITMEVPTSALTTTLAAPEGAERKVLPGLHADRPLWAVTGFSLVGVTAADDALAKHLLDVTPTFVVAGSHVAGAVTKKPQLPATGIGVGWAGLLLLGGALALRRGLRGTR